MDSEKLDTLRQLRKVEAQLDNMEFDEKILNRFDIASFYERCLLEAPDEAVLVVDIEGLQVSITWHRPGTGVNLPPPKVVPGTLVGTGPTGIIAPYGPDYPGYHEGSSPSSRRVSEF